MTKIGIIMKRRMGSADPWTAIRDARVISEAIWFATVQDAQLTATDDPLIFSDVLCNEYTLLKVEDRRANASVR